MQNALALKQCHANVETVLAHHKLIPGILLAIMTDRVLYRRVKPFMRRLEQLVPEHFEKWPFNRNHGLTAIDGWRERTAKCSMQIVEHDHGVLEVDFDLYNPNHGLLPAIGHLFEVWTPGKTDPFKVARGLRKRGLDVPDMRNS